MTLEEIRGLLEKASPGPWKIDTTYADSEGIIIRPESTGYGFGTIWPRDVDFHVDAYEYFGGSPADNAALIAAAPELAALLVRAVEALRPFAYPQPYDEYAIVGHDGHGHPLNAEGVQRLSAQSFLRELGVEA